MLAMQFNNIDPDTFHTSLSRDHCVVAPASNTCEITCPIIDRKQRGKLHCISTQVYICSQSKQARRCKEMMHNNKTRCMNYRVRLLHTYQYVQQAN